MRKYRVPVVKTIYAFVEVDAESEMDAISAVNEMIDNEEIDDNLDESSVDYEVQEDVDDIGDTDEYQKAYEYADTMDWYVNEELDVDYFYIMELASDAEMETNIPKTILAKAMCDYLKNELGYEV